MLRSYGLKKNGIFSFGVVGFALYGESITAPILNPVSVPGNNAFVINWDAVTDAIGYYVDVATDALFSNILPGYDNLDLGNVVTTTISGLDPDTTYYYQLRAYTTNQTSDNSETGTATTIPALLLTARGIGTGVGYFNVSVSSAVTISVNGDAKLYTDAAGTLGESTSRVLSGPGNTTVYIRLATGTADLMFSDCSKVTQFGSVTTPSSGSPAYSYNTISVNPANVPSLNFMNLNFPNLTEISLFYGNLNVSPFVLADMPSTLTKIIAGGSGTMTGTLSDLPPNITVCGLNQDNTISGNINVLPSSLTQFSIGGQTTISGDVQYLPSGLTYLSIAGNNTVTGDISALPSGLTILSIVGQNTLSGDITSLPSGLLQCTIAGQNTVHGDIADFPTTLTNLNIGGNNTITGTLNDWPAAGCNSIVMSGNNTVTGGFANLPTNLYNLTMTGNFNTINGDIADLGSNVGQFEVGGQNTVSGNLADLAMATLYTFNLTGNNTVTGDLANLPATTYAFTCSGLNTIYGDIASIPATLYSLSLSGRNTVSDYSGKVWSLTGYQIIVIPFSGGLSDSEVDQLLIDIDGSTFSGSFKHVSLLGTNAARTVASNIAVLSLQAKGVTVTTN